MANNDKLWFELGVRDNITRELERILHTTNELAKAISIIGKDPIVPGVKNSYDNVAKLKEALTRIGSALSNLRSAKLKIVDPKDLADINKMQLALGRMRAKIDRFITDMSSKPNIMGEKDVAEGFLSSIGYDTAISQVSSKTKEYTQTQRDATQATRELGSANRSLMQTYEQVANAGEKNNRILQQMNNQIATYFSIYGAERFLKNVVTIGGQFEYQHRALQNILGDVQEANTLFSQIQGLAVESPKTFMELTNYVKQLSAYQIPASELYETTNRLADISSGLGVDMSRLILAYGQVRSAAVLRGQELRQFTEAGIPIVQALADKFTEMNGKLTTTADVFKLISKRAVPFEMVKDILWDMTNQGGKFYNMQSELADTLYGKWQKLQDTWQIMLGHIADGQSIAGKTLKSLIEGAVALTRSFDVLIPLISGIALANINKNVFGGLYKRYSALTDSGAINNMQVAKQKQAAMLEKERVLYGKQLTATEKELIRNKNVLVSQDYALLAVEDKISEKKAYQLMLDGKMKRKDFEKLLIAKQYTEEQRRQILNGNTQLLRGGNFFSRIGGNIWGFIGGWSGAVITAIGAVSAAYSYFTQESEELRQKSDAMVSHAEQGANSIAKALNNASADSTTEKKIEALEESLLQLGSTGESIVARSREYMDDINKRWDILKEGAEDYKKTLELMGTSQGKALYEKSLDDSGIESRIKSYDNAINEMYKTQGLLKHYDEIYKLAIKNITDKNEKLRDAISGKNVFEQIETIGQDKLIKEIYVNRNNQYGALNASAISALNIYFNRVRDIKKEWNDVAENSIPKMVDALRAVAEERGITDFNNLSQENKRTLETIVRDYSNGLQEASSDARNKLAEELARQAFRIDIIGNLKVDTTKMSGFADYVWKRFGGEASPNGSVEIGENTFTKAQVANIFDNIGNIAKMNSEYDAKIKEAARLEKAGAKNLAKAATDEANAVLSILDTFNLRETKSGSGGSKKDGTLKQWQERKKALDEYYKLYQEYSQYMTRKEAIKRINDTGLIPGQDLPENIDDYLAVMKKFMDGIKGQINNTERQSFWDSLVGDYNKKDFEKNTKEVIDATLRQLDEELKKQSKQWDLYKKILDATGNKEQAAQFAFGRSTNFENFAEQLRSEISDALQKNDLAKGKTIDELLGMDDDALKKIDIFEKGVDGVHKKLKQLKDVEENLNTVNADLWLKAITNAKELDTQIALINQKYEEMRKALERNRTAQNSEQTDKALLGIDKSNREEIAKATWDNFKATEEWGRIFSNLDNITTNTLEYMLDKLRSVAPSIRDSVEATKALYEAMDKIQNQLYERNPFAALGDYFSKMSAFREKAAELKGAKGTDKIYLSPESAEKMGLSVDGKGWSGTVQEFLDAMYKESKGFSRIVAGIGKAFKALQDVLQPVIDLFDQLGMTTLSDIFQIGNNALGSAASVANGISSLQGMFDPTSGMGKFLSGAGPWAAAIGAGMSVVSGLFAMHDKALQEEIEASKTRQQEMENLSKNIESALGRVLGGVYEFARSQNSQAFREEFNKEALKRIAFDSIYQKYKDSRDLNGITGAILKGLAGSDTTVGYFKTAAKTQEYYDMQRALLAAQQQELQRQLSAEEDKKDSDANAIANYKQQIKELGDQIQFFALDMAKALYDIDIHSWAQELTDAVVEAWENGEDAAEAYTNKVKDLMKGLTKNILAQKIMEKAFENAHIDEMIAQMMDVQSGKLNESNVGQIADALFAVGETSTNAILSILDEMERRGYIDKDGNSSSSTSAGIKSITENTADLIASYLNAIRGDGSVNRATLEQILIAVQTGTRMPVIAEAQLRELQTIVSLARERNQLVGEMRDVLHKIDTGQTSIRVQ